MQRRRFVTGGLAGTGAAAAGGAAAVLPAGCAPLGLGLSGADGDEAGEDELPDPAFVADVVASLDRRLDWIDQQDLSPLFRPPGRTDGWSDAEHARSQRLEHLFRSAVRTLYLAGRFLDLPDAVKVHPDVQDRMWAAQPEMDFAVLGMTELLEGLGQDELRDLQKTLAAHPDLGEELARRIDGPAKEDGIPFRRRLDLRGTLLELAIRMGAQWPGLVIDPYVDRVRRMRAVASDEMEMNRRLAARVGSDTFARQQRRVERLARAWQRRLAQAPAPGTRVPAAPRTQPSPAKGRGRRVVSVGGWMMGLGLGSVLLGLLFNVVGAEGLFLVFSVTVGPALLVLGLLVVLVGGLASIGE